MAINNNFYKNRKLKDFYFSLWFLILTIFLTIFLYFYNFNLETKNKNLKTELVKVNNDIKKLEENKSIIVYNIYSKNRIVFDRIAKQSKIPTFIRHLKRIYNNYNIQFTWFSYSNWKISTKVLVETDQKKSIYNDWEKKYSDMKLAYMKIINLLEVYNQSSNALFKLDQVMKFSWYNNMKFNAIFELK